jgi:hypothetical protein
MTLRFPYNNNVKKLQLSHYGPGQSLKGSGSLRLPDILDSVYMKVVRSALRTGRLCPPGNFPGTRFCYRLSRPQGRNAAGRVKSMEKYQ